MYSRDLIEQYKGYVQDWRRYFHKHPELSNEEFETTKTLAKELDLLQFLLTNPFLSDF